jgi:hypothetical protein
VVPDSDTPPHLELVLPMARELDNKALVLLAFDTLFNKRDYARAEAFWAQDYI